MKHLSIKMIKIIPVVFVALAALIGFTRSAAISANNEKSNEKLNPATVFSGKPINAYGDFRVLVSDDFDPATGEFTTSVKSYEVVIDGTRYPAILPANTRRHYSKNNVPIRGTLHKGTITLGEEPFGILDSSEYAAKDVDVNRLGSYGVASEIGGVVEYFQNINLFNARLRDQIEWESKIGPDKPAARSEQTESSSWTEGTKKLLFMRLDFSDDPVAIGTEQEVLNIMDNNVSPFFLATSYNKTSIQTTVTTVLRLPHPRTYYEQPGYGPSILNDGRDAAINAGYSVAHFQFLVAAIKNNLSSMCTNGAPACAIAGSGGIWLSSGAFSAYGLAHEMGHGFGLEHAREWVSANDSPIGPGYSNKYGDIFDVMGSGLVPPAYFNASYKSLLDWLSPGNVRTVINDGTYRVYSHDNATEGGIRALKIKKDDAKDYWLSHREATTNSYLDNGVQFHWRENSVNFYSDLLEMHLPHSQSTSPLLIGESFTDNEEHIKFSVLDDGSVPQSVNVKIEFNVGCTYSLAQSSASFGASGGEGSITVNTQAGCAPPATDDSKWIQVLESKEGTPNETVRYIVSPNYGAARAGTISVAGLTFTVNQSAQATACVAAPSGLVAWWRGEGNVLDQAMKNGGPATDLTRSFAAGKIGGAFRTLDVTAGNSATSAPLGVVPDSPSLSATNSLTIEGWVNMNSADDPFSSIIKRLGDLPYHSAYFVDLIDSKIFFTINSNADPNISTAVTVTTAPIAHNQFVHFAATLDDATGSMKIYLNGTVIDQTTTSIRPFQITSNGKIWIGEGSGTHDYSIDELSVYNRSLSAAEVQSIYNAGNAPTGAAGKCPIGNVNRTAFDFDGDRRADLSIANRSASQILWQTLNSQTGASDFQFGLSAGDKLVPADYDNDGKTDVAVYRSGTWYLQRSTAGFAAVQWGLSDDVPQPADFTGDGRAELVVFRPSSGIWYALNLVNFQYTGVQWGMSGDKPVVGDYDGDGIADYAVYRPSDTLWYLLQSTNGFAAPQFGISTDITVPADYDGDGKTDLAVFRASTGWWYVLRSSDSGVTYKNLGQTGDYPVPMDYDGDGETDIAVWRQSSTLYRNGEWIVSKSSDDKTVREYFGNPPDVAVPTAFTNDPY